MATTHIRVDEKIKDFIWTHKGKDSVANYIRKALIDAHRYRVEHSAGQRRADAAQRLDELLEV